MSTYMRTYISEYMSTCMSACMSAYTYTHMYVHMAADGGDDDDDDHCDDGTILLKAFTVGAVRNLLRPLPGPGIACRVPPGANEGRRRRGALPRAGLDFSWGDGALLWKGC